MNRFKVSTVLTTLSLFLAHCSEVSNVSSQKGLDVENSNISSNTDADIKSIKILPNTKIPKGVFVKHNEYTAKFVSDLYATIYAINKTDGLSGNEGRNQEITLV